MDKQITFRLILILAVYAVLTFAAKKRWLHPPEVAWIGGAMIFSASGVLFYTVLPFVVVRYPVHWQALALTGALILPVLIALVFTLSYMVRRMKKEDAAAEATAVEKIDTKPAKKSKA